MSYTGESRVLSMHGLRHYMFRALHGFERKAASAQGKGYGSTNLEREVKQACSLMLRKPRLAVDIGGNVGDYSAALRRRFPKLEIHIFEPSAKCVQVLKERFGSDSLVEIVPLALSNETGSATLFTDRPGSGLSSLVKRRLDHFGILFNNEEQVSTARFEDYWKERLDKRQLDLVKMDIEGHELAALDGFGEALYATTILQFEFGGCNIDTRSSFQDFWYFFAKNAFALHRITPLGLQKIDSYDELDEFYRTTNYVALNLR